MKNQKRHGQASEDDRLPLRVPTRCPIFSRNWAGIVACAADAEPAAARLAPSGRLEPEHSRAAQ